MGLQDHHTMPFKKWDATPLDAYHIGEPGLVQDATEQVKCILEAKYKPADLHQV